MAGHTHGVGFGVASAVLLLVALLATYLVAAGARRRAGARWSALRTASFVLGIGLLLFAISPPVADFAHESLRGHMLQHLLLGMYAPLALVLAGPGELFLRTVPARTARSVVALLATRPVRFLIHPVTAAVLDMGGMYLLYLTPLHALSVRDPLVHVLVHVHFVVAGYLFAWSIAGTDPAPHRPGMPLRLAVLVVASGAHATLAKLMYAYGFPRGTGAPAAELEAAAKLMYYGGDLAELVLAAMFFAVWLGQRRVRSALDARTPLRLPWQRSPACAQALAPSAGADRAAARR